MCELLGIIARDNPDKRTMVREGEFATAEQSGGLAPQLTNLYNRIVSGERLTTDQRLEFIRAAEGLYGEVTSNLSDFNTQFGTRFPGSGVDPSRVIMQPETFAPIGEGDIVTLPSGNWYRPGQ